MAWSILLGGIWIIAAFLISISPRRIHWAGAKILIPLAIPLLVLLFQEQGSLVGLVGLAIVVSVLRWPVYFLLRWLARQLGFPVTPRDG
ncbi:MAG: DUF2484 family protein [Rubricella sp.]